MDVEVGVFLLDDLQEAASDQVQPDDLAVNRAAVAEIGRGHGAFLCGERAERAGGVRVVFEGFAQARQEGLPRQFALVGIQPDARRLAQGIETKVLQAVGDAPVGRGEQERG